MKKLIIFGILFCLFSINSFAQLKLTSPNGGEKFVVGSDTLITWEGILSTDTVKLEYSIDKGIIWKLISDKATGLKYIWKNVPKPTSKECLVRIKPFSKVDSSNFEPQIEWQKTYGGSQEECIYDIIQTSDGGYITAGWTLSSDGDITGKNGSEDAWIFKLDNLGNIEWQKTYGYNLEDRAVAIQQTSDKGYIFAGWTGIDGGRALWVFKLDITGNRQWELKYKFHNYDRNSASSIRQTSDGGYIVVGTTAKNNKSSEGLILKINESGNIIWEKSYAKENFNGLTMVQKTADKGYIVSGGTSVTMNSSQNYLLIKLGALGNLEWDKTYGMNDSASGFRFVQQTAEGTYIVIGDIIKNLNNIDALIMKIDAYGNKEWQKIFSGSKTDYLTSIYQTKDDKYIAIGTSASNDGDFTGNYGNTDGRIFKLNKTWDILWQKNIGGTGYDIIWKGQPTKDGGYIISGITGSNDIPGCINKGGNDCYIVKVGPAIQTDQSDSTFSIVAPQAQAFDIDMKKQIVGTRKDSLITDFVTNVGECKILVDSIYFSGADKDAFKLISNFPKYSLIPGESKVSHIEFTPNRIGLHTAKINIITQSDTLIRNIQGIGVGGILVCVLNDSAYAGDIRRLKLIMSGLKPEVVANFAPNFSAKIRFQKTILTPLKKSERNVVNDSSYMNISGKVSTTNELGQLLVVAGLGTVEETTIDIVEFILKDDLGNKVNYEIEKQAGLFKLLGICREGGTRLINPTGKVEILSIIPNPASEDIEIKVNLIEEGVSTISVYNLNGAKLREFSLNEGTGLKTINLNLKDFDNGLYFIELQTPTVVNHQKLMIVR